MNFYTVVLRQSSGYWVGLCLENGIVGQGDTQEDAVNKLKDAIASKTQTKSSADKFGLSWTFQCGKQRKDTILDQPESWVCFVQCDDSNTQYNCIVYPPIQIEEIKFGKPKLLKLRGEKLVVYAEENQRKLGI